MGAPLVGPVRLRRSSSTRFEIVMLKAPSLLLLLLGAAHGLPTTGLDGGTVEPVDDVEVAAYLGRWYQTHASFNVKYSFELGGNCVTADYGPGPFNDTITVRNTVRLFSWSSWFGVVPISGYAAQSPSEPAKLEVSLGPFADPKSRKPFDPPGNYWIVDLGPKNEDSKYEWAVVSGPDQSQLYVLARDVADFKQRQEAAVLESVRAKGFTSFWNKPRETNQEHCTY